LVVGLCLGKIFAEPFTPAIGNGIHNLATAAHARILLHKAEGLIPGTEQMLMI
jgi:hypothetical protein